MTSGSVAGERAKREIHSTAKILRMFNVNSAECPSKRNGNEIMGKASHFSVGRCRSRCESFVALPISTRAKDPQSPARTTPLIRISSRRITHGRRWEYDDKLADTGYGRAYFSALMQSQTKDGVTEGVRQQPISLDTGCTGVHGVHQVTKHPRRRMHRSVHRTRERALALSRKVDR